ncbi:T9SS type A sorting domain-containing protein [Algibacter lectus]|uniref:T9SS type A sorting domain-containing protein n=1 Tax=Algibacter lectus TaxID=221126 RepID=UPI0026EAAC4D|nr:T9SS type A sorting domain-containing protein [Algibacter lectus]MDO7137645.1 T9SS type A sorting domain-containing protein [Algibacter lectus]
MKQNSLNLLLFVLFSLSINAQSYAPKAGADGSTAIHRDSEDLVAWATGAEVVRGPQNIANPTGSLATVGEADNAIGKSNGVIVSLGDGGTAVLTFENPIVNNVGFDFAVFENSFSDTFLELAFVEVSSDGANFFRFPSHSQTQTDTQVGGFGSIDPTYINNLAGKYRASYGTPFDLDDITDNALLNKNAITHVKLIDVIGTIDPAYASYDSYENIVNDPYATPFGSSGFDLDAIGVLKQVTLSLNDKTATNALGLYPNPATSQLYVSKSGTVTIYSVTGKLVLKQLVGNKATPISVARLNSGVYIVKLTTTEGVLTQKLIKN